ncbi:E3 ubiquitin-protein ligase RHF1A isoform X2 [Mercurialis annua]|uniref:E3 ubiquitin-protein ligase RHF1A isoform X2 n=1 Tax=Mercurialis annua TaxID=3986 RepID=UPI00215EA61C|nr:E3 ubiquitin-protein ligase RHF1A isoform X2 [Mercurialis annua]
MSVTFSSSSVTDCPIFPAASVSAAPLAAAGGSGGCSSSEAALDYCFDDNCSICLEPFTSLNPSTVTSCKHEYHLQCILEWSQRSKECPICWQLLSLKEPGCQELLAAVETERRLRSRNSSSAAATSSSLAHVHEDLDVEQDSFSDDSDFDERVMQHLAAVASRAHNFRRRERQISSTRDPSQGLIFPSPVNAHSAQQTQASAEFQVEYQDISGCNSGTPLMASQPLPSLDTAVSRDIPSKPRLQSHDAPQTPTRGSSFSDSIKSKLVAASARYKESISKSTRDIKEKIAARNNSVKELSKGVQREMSAGIAGVTRMIERLDLTPKRNGASSPVSGCRAGTPSNISVMGKNMHENISAQTADRFNEETASVARLDSPSHVTRATEVHHIQRDC